MRGSICPSQTDVIPEQNHLQLHLLSCKRYSFILLHGWKILWPKLLRYATPDPRVNLMCTPRWPQTHNLLPWRNSQVNAEVLSSIRLNGTASLGSLLRCLHLCLLGRGPENPAGSGAVLQGRERANAGLVAKTAVTMDHWNLSPEGKTPGSGTKYKTQDYPTKRERELESL